MPEKRESEAKTVNAAKSDSPVSEEPISSNGGLFANAKNGLDALCKLKDQD